MNSWVLSVVEAGAETVALCEGLGLRPQLLFEEDFSATYLTSAPPPEL